MLYFDPNSIDGIDNYKVVITRVSDSLIPTGVAVPFPQKLYGIMNDKEISLPFGVSLTNQGDIKGASGIVDALGSLGKGLGNATAHLGAGGKAGAGLLNKAGGYINTGVSIAKSIASAGSDIAQSLTGLEPEKQQAVYTVVRPEGWSKPSFEFKCTFYKGMKIGGTSTPSFKEFVKQVAVPMLPSQQGPLVTSMLQSNQVDYKHMLSLLTEGMGLKGGESGGLDNGKSIGFGVRIGNILKITQGLWMTGAKITAPTAFDSKGQPIYWDVSFTFEYYRMPTIKDFQGWLNT